MLLETHYIYDEPMALSTNIRNKTHRFLHRGNDPHNNGASGR